MIPQNNVRIIGISAHIDAGKTTISERIVIALSRYGNFFMVATTLA
jgi:translation elongation factor EF-G